MDWIIIGVIILIFICWGIESKLDKIHDTLQDIYEEVRDKSLDDMPEDYYPGI